MDYNYERYKMSNYDLNRFDGPADQAKMNAD